MIHLTVWQWSDVLFHNQGPSQPLHHQGFSKGCSAEALHPCSQTTAATVQQFSFLYVKWKVDEVFWEHLLNKQLVECPLMRWEPQHQTRSPDPCCWRLYQSCPESLTVLDAHLDEAHRSTSCPGQELPQLWGHHQCQKHGGPAVSSSHRCCHKSLDRTEKKRREKKLEVHRFQVISQEAQSKSLLIFRWRPQALQWPPRRIAECVWTWLERDSVRRDIAQVTGTLSCAHREGTWSSLPNLAPCDCPGRARGAQHTAGRLEIPEYDLVRVLTNTPLGTD